MPVHSGVGITSPYAGTNRDSCFGFGGGNGGRWYTLIPARCQKPLIPYFCGSNGVATALTLSFEKSPKPLKYLVAGARFRTNLTRIHLVEDSPKSKAKQNMGAKRVCVAA